MNTYGYVGGNPLSYTDPLGLLFAPKYSGNTSRGPKTWQETANDFRSMSNAAAWASTASLVTGNPEVAIPMGLVSLGLDLFGTAIEVVFVDEINITNLAGITTNAGIMYIGSCATKAVPGPFKQPVSIAFDAATQINDIIFDAAANNDKCKQASCNE